MKLSTLKALIDGDIKNALISETPGGIEVQEKRGQVAFVANQTLPLEFNHGKKSDLERFGVVFGEPIDDLFQAVSLPPGWTKQATEHSMWSKLIDDEGRERASIFYKAAFYDRSAHISLARRYSYQVAPVSGWEGDYKKSEWHCIATDGDTVIWQSDERAGVEPEYSEETRAIWLEWRACKESLDKIGKQWLDAHYPDWQSVTAYWDFMQE